MRKLIKKLLYEVQAVLRSKENLPVHMLATAGKPTQPSVRLMADLIVHGLVASVWGGLLTK